MRVSDNVHLDMDKLETSTPEDFQRIFTSTMESDDVEVKLARLNIYDTAKVCTQNTSFYVASSRC
jgi:hypothetical protein